MPRSSWGEICSQFDIASLFPGIFCRDLSPGASFVDHGSSTVLTPLSLLPIFADLAEISKSDGQHIQHDYFCGK
jgi:hypothetical protein